MFNPKWGINESWKMFFIGLWFAALSTILVKVFFQSDQVLAEASGILIVTFCVMFTLPYMFFVIKRESEEDETVEGFFNVWNAHKDAIYSFTFLFLGFIVAFSLLNIFFEDNNLFNAQLETYCVINNPYNVQACVNQFSFGTQASFSGASITRIGRFTAILENNIYVMIFTLLFSLIFGAGAIFVLAWNATVISSAVGIFSKHSFALTPIAFLRYMIHGVPEIGAYFVTALAGGIFGTAVLRNGFRGKRFFRVLANVILLLFIALTMLIIAAIIEVYITPALFL